MEDMLAEVKGFFNGALEDVQVRIDRKLKRVKELSEKVVEHKDVADANDATLHACRKQELAMFTTSSSVADALAALRAEKEKVCAQRDLAKYFNWTVRRDFPQRGLCDFQELNGQKCIIKSIARNAQNLSKEFEMARANYFNLKGDCQNAMDALDRQLEEDEVTVAPSSDYYKRKADCNLVDTKTSLSVCAFGDRLQEKCNAVDAWRELVDKVSNRNGALQSLHYASQELKCALQDLMGPEGDEPCVPESFESVTGGFNDRSAEIKVYTSGRFFACEDGPISFWGKRINLADNPGSQWEVDFAPTFTARPMGATSFDMCTAFFSMTTTTYTDTTTTGTTTTPPNTTTTTFLPGFP
jgi:hypothetical protein